MASKKRGGGLAGVDNTFRKTWDVDEYAEKAKSREDKAKIAEELALDERKRKRIERDPLHQGIIVQRANLKARETQIDLAAKLGKTQMHSLTAPLSQQAGFYCEVCDCILKDSHAYLDHINGKWHNRALGMTMRVEKSTAEQVRKRLQEAKRRKRGELVTDTGDEKYIPDGFDRVKILSDEKALKEKGEHIAVEADEKESSSETEIRAADEQERNSKLPDIDEEAMAIMGFAGFGGSKKN